ncbi:hypothetical protein [Tenacibaculum ovolyticum]|uniref:hypothetical protein n=1 Tax=Tenacibaculum ovolyticum TaxID=104270 RepID=UPI0007ECD156|nr:hypothetical protein [Tenacibaculum ovolyticum]
MSNNDIKIHEKIGKTLLSIMNDFDVLNHELMKLHNESYEYAAPYLNQVSNMKDDCKKILNKDFDRLALNRKV